MLLARVRVLGEARIRPERSLPMSRACFNIGPRQRKLRLVIGLVLLAVAGGSAAALGVDHATRPYRALVFVPLLLGCISLLQVRAGTCVSLAARGKKNLDDGEVVVADPAERRQLAAQARGVMLQAIALAGLATAAFYVW
jgi:hypothetical protein